MTLYTVKTESTAKGRVVLDDMLLTKDMPTAAGSRMLAGYQSLFDAEVLTRLLSAGFAIGGKVAVGEFGLDLLGETAADGALVKDGVPVYPAAALLKEDYDVLGVVGVDANGAPRRAAAIGGLCALKPTYGIISRFGAIPAAASTDTISLMARTPADCLRLLQAVAGHDDKDGTSHKETRCRAAAEKAAPITSVGVPAALFEGCAPEVKAAMEAEVAALKAAGITVKTVEEKTLSHAHEAFNILFSAELCNNVSRYDGVKYGYRTDAFSSIDELYTKSRTEAFGELLKYVILFGSETLSTENYSPIYDKALRVRRLVAEELSALLSEVGALLLPVTPRFTYRAEELMKDVTLPFEENRFTAIPSLVGFPSVTAGGCALVGAPFSDSALLALLEAYRKESV